MRTPLIMGNWKMNKTPEESAKLAEEIKKGVSDIKDREVVIAPPFTSLERVRRVIEDSPIKLGAQNMHWEPSGAYTGEISGEFLIEIGCRYVILGHSERRKYFQETDEIINRKFLYALKIGLTPVLCVGETLLQREGGETFEVIREQLLKCLEGIDLREEVVIAYEPIWAIGTGRTATPKQASEVHSYIRRLLLDKYNSENIRILYGGSVKPDNIDSLMAQSEIDGVLVGGASLIPESFIRIVKFEGG